MAREPAEPPHPVLSPAGDPLLASKLAIPRTVPSPVLRARLLERISRGTRGPLTLVSAAAGYGKTVLAASWSDQACPSTSVAWLSLDESDDHVGTFWFYVVEALRSAGAPIPDLPPIDGPDEVSPSFLARLAGGLAHRPEPVVLVLDEFDALTEPAIATSLDHVVRCASPGLRVVLVARADPLPLINQYRLRGELEEVRAADLAFTPHEATRLLRKRDIVLAEDDVATLVERLDGWPACLCLLAIVLRSTDDRHAFVRGLAMTDRTLADYLVTEVLDAQPAYVRDFLLRTSVLDRVWPGLADALTGRTDGVHTLSHLQHDLVMVRLLDPEQGSYRYTGLLSEVLRLQLRFEHPEWETELHQRAALWLSNQGRVVDAVSHASAVDWGDAAALLVDHLAVGRLAAGPQTSRIARSVADMPADATGPEAAVTLAARALSRGEPDAARALLGEATSPAAPPARPSTRLACALVRAQLAATTGDSPEGISATTQALDLLRTVTGSVSEVTAARVLAHGLRDAALLWAGDHEAAESSLHAALALDDGSDVPLRVHLLGQLALLEAVRGNLRKAAALAGSAEELAAHCGMGMTVQRDAAQLAAAWVAHEQGTPPVDLPELDRVGDGAGSPLVAVLAAVLRALELHGRSDHAGALAAVSEGRLRSERETRAPSLPGWLAVMLASTEARIHRARDDSERALAVLGAVARPLGAADAADLDVALAQVRLAGGEPTTAAGLVSPLVSDGVGASPRLRTDAHLVLGHCATLLGQPERARREVGAALGLASAEARREPFLSAGPWLVSLVSGDPALMSAHAWLDVPGMRARTAVPPRQRAPGTNGESPVVIESLSRREHEVLEQLSEMMSTQEIAEALYVSPNTVKTHLKSIYRKLGASRRSEAVRRARALELL